MLLYLEGDIFSTPAQVIVNPVNTVGVMGKGLALSFKNRYPKMFYSYRHMCEKKMFDIGKLMLYYAEDYTVLLFPTKENWRYPSKLEYIERGLKRFVEIYEEKQIMSIAFPKLGCGNGELSWSDVKPIMEFYLKDLPINVYVYLGNGDQSVVEHKQAKETFDWLKMNAKDMSFRGVEDDLIVNSTLMPIAFEYDGNCINTIYMENEGLVFNAGDEKICIQREHFYKVWDDIREKEVFLKSATNRNNNLIMELLYTLGYISKVRVFENESNVCEGYQINSGLGRMYDFKEV